MRNAVKKFSMILISTLLLLSLITPLNNYNLAYAEDIVTVDGIEFDKVTGANIYYS